jgi:hypothetical protein
MVRRCAEDTARYAEDLAAAADIAGRKRLEDERDALRDRKALDDLLPKAKAEVTRLAQLDRITKCLTETGTKAITTSAMTLLIRSSRRECGIASRKRFRSSPRAGYASMLCALVASTGRRNIKFASSPTKRRKCIPCSAKVNKRVLRSLYS